MKKLAHRRCLPRLSRGRGTRALRRALLNLFGQPLQSVRASAIGRPASPGREAGGLCGVTVQYYCTTYIEYGTHNMYMYMCMYMCMYMNMKAAPYRSRRARRAAERPSTFSYSVAVTWQLAAVGRVILTWRARPARPSTRGALLLRDYARARPARPAHEREAALSGSRARPARPAHEREASLPPRLRPWSWPSGEC